MSERRKRWRSKFCVRVRLYRFLRRWVNLGVVRVGDIMV